MKLKTGILLAIAMTVTSVGQAQVTYEQTQIKADRYFDQREWANAAAMYTFMLEERPEVADTYGRAIVANTLVGNEHRPGNLLHDAMTHGVPLDSLLQQVQKYSFRAGSDTLYERFLLRMAQENPWLERPIDSHLVKYYNFRRNGPEMVRYADKMLSGKPDNVQYLMIKADGYMLQNMGKEAEDTWKRTLEYYPNNYEALIHLANYYQQEGEKRLAKMYFERANSIRPTPYVTEQIRQL